MFIYKLETLEYIIFQFFTRKLEHLAIRYGCQRLTVYYT